jgi:hypothetical protein
VHRHSATARLVVQWWLAGCGKTNSATGILSSLGDFIIREGSAESAGVPWIHFRACEHTAISAFVACIARFRIRTKL